MSFDNIFDSVMAAAIAASEMPEISAGRKKQVVIDGSTASVAENTRWRGLGMVSANNTSRLLMDYKAQHPERYNELLQYMFGRDGLALSHLKIEAGSDVNSTSGTEPCPKRHEDEIADVTRGAGFQLCADAKMINPDLTLDLLWWSEPRWVTASSDDMAARYQWYKEMLVAAYGTYGLKFDYVSANRNERTVDPAWIVYLSHALKSEKDTPYDFSAIKVVASDEDNSWATSQKMLQDRSLLEAVDVVGSHYTSHSTEQTRTLIKQHGKEAWFSEAAAPMAYAKGTRHFDGGSGLVGIGGVLDIANRIITMYPEGGMTLHEFQPVVSAYYDGATFYHKQLIVANEPWCGYYLLDSGYYMALHFSQFFNKGWTFVDSACAGDGVKGGDGHAIVDAVYSYMTACDPDSGDYSIAVTNTTSESIIYEFEVKNLAKFHAEVDVWETRGSMGSADENYFRKISTLIPSVEGESGTYSVTVKPHSLVTITTLKKQRPDCSMPQLTEQQRVMPLPYCDDFSYADKGEGFLAARGGMPLYMTDMGGAFEVAADNGRNVLKQKITEQLRAEEWGYTPNPVTCLGDDRWLNYSVSCDVKLAQGEGEIYVGCGLRYNFGAAGWNGWWLQVSTDGKFGLYRGKKLIKCGSVALQEWNALKIEAVDNCITAWVNGNLAAAVDADKEKISMQSAGRASLYSSFHENCFANLKIQPVEGDDTVVTRYDCTDDNVMYSGDWLHSTIDSFKYYKRTIATGNDGAQFEALFSGTGLVLVGENIQDGAITVVIDGETVAENVDILRTDCREAFWHISGLPNGKHKAVVTVSSGTVAIDSIEAIRSAESVAEPETESIPEVEMPDVNIMEVQSDVEQAVEEEAAEAAHPTEEEAPKPSTNTAKIGTASFVEQEDCCDYEEEWDVPSVSLTVLPQQQKKMRSLLPIIAAAGAGAAVLTGIIIAVAVKKKRGR